MLRLLIALSGWILLESAVMADAGEVRIGVLMELSGPGASIAADAREGLEMAMSVLPKPAGFGVKLVYGDSRDDPKAALAEFERMVEAERVLGVIVARSRIAMPLNPLSARSAVPLIGGVGHPAFLSGNPYALRVFPNAEEEGAFLARKARELGVRRLATITLQDEWTSSLTRAFIEESRKLGISIAAEEVVAEGETEFSSVSLRVRQFEPDGVFLNLLLAQTGLVARKLHEQRVHAQLFSNYWIQKRETLETAGKEALEGAVFVEPDTDQPEFTKKYHDLYPDKPITPTRYAAYVIVGAVLEALRPFSLPPGREEFSATLLTLEEVSLLDGKLPFRRREARFPLRAKRLKNGRVQNM